MTITNGRSVTTLLSVRVINLLFKLDIAKQELKVRLDIDFAGTWHFCVSKEDLSQLIEGLQEIKKEMA